MTTTDLTSPGDGASVARPVPDRAGDLDTRSAIHDLVVAFYREIVFDDVLAPIFVEVAETDWGVHIPRLIDYWCTILLGERGYNGALLEAHREVDRREPFRAEHFDRWLQLWVAAVDARWRGPRAEHAKSHAAATAALICRRLREPHRDPRPADHDERPADHDEPGGPR